MAIDRVHHSDRRRPDGFLGGGRDEVQRGRGVGLGHGHRQVDPPALARFEGEPVGDDLDRQRVGSDARLGTAQRLGDDLRVSDRGQPHRELELLPRDNSVRAIHAGVADPRRVLLLAAGPPTGRRPSRNNSTDRGRNVWRTWQGRTARARGRRWGWRRGLDSRWRRWDSRWRLWDGRPGAVGRPVAGRLRAARVRQGSRSCGQRDRRVNRGARYRRHGDPDDGEVGPRGCQAGLLGEDERAGAGQRPTQEGPAQAAATPRDRDERGRCQSQARDDNHDRRQSDRGLIRSLAGQSGPAAEPAAARSCHDLIEPRPERGIVGGWDRPTPRPGTTAHRWFEGPVEDLPRHRPKPEHRPEPERNRRDSGFRGGMPQPRGRSRLAR